MFIYTYFIKNSNLSLLNLWTGASARVATTTSTRTTTPTTSRFQTAIFKLKLCNNTINNKSVIHRSFCSYTPILNLNIKPNVTQAPKSETKNLKKKITNTRLKSNKNILKKRYYEKLNVKQKIVRFLYKRRRKNLKRFKMMYETFKAAQPEKFGLVTINKTKNNTHGVISSLFGSCQTLWSTSGGVYANKVDGRRKTRYVQRAVYQNINAKLLSLGLQFLIIHCKGTFMNKRFIFKMFSKNLKVLLIKDITGIPHNGCRPPKIRRV